MIKPFNKKLLSDSNFQLPDNVTIGPTDDMPEKIIQFGEGNFLRGFVDWMVDGLNEKGMFQGKVAVVQPIQVGIAHLVNDQDGLYTLILRGLLDGESHESRRIITSISRGLDPYEEWRTVLDCAHNPELRFMLSNTTEAGIVYTEEPYVPYHCPNSFPAKVTAFLYERYQAFGGDPQKGMIMMPCELIERNGDALKRKVLKHAQAWNIEKKFMDWINSSNYFLNTLVDRIVPGYPEDEIETLSEELGYDDRLLVAAEPFHLWVIEGPKELAEEIPFHKAGYNVIWTEDMTPYRTRKVRILNGAHTASVLAAFLAELDFVHEMMDDDVFGSYLEETLFKEIMPTMDMDASELEPYTRSVIERFKNKTIKHPLHAISLNSVSKWKVRILPSVLDFIGKNGRPPQLLTFSLAALIRFYQGVGTAKRELRGRRNNHRYAIRDNIDVLSFFEKRWYAFEHNHDIRALATTVLANEELWDTDLTILPAFIDTVTAHLQRIMISGSRDAAKALIEDAA